MPKARTWPAVKLPVSPPTDVLLEDRSLSIIFLLCTALSCDKLMLFSLSLVKLFGLSIPIY